MSSSASPSSSSRLAPEGESSSLDASAQPPRQVHCGKDLICQFDKVLQLSSVRGRTSRCSSLPVSASSDSGWVSKRRRHKTRVKKAFSLRPSRLVLPPPVASHQEHFSFDNCSKELESIMRQKSGSSGLRPRSSSLPSSSSTLRGSAKGKTAAAAAAPHVTFSKRVTVIPAAAAIKKGPKVRHGEKKASSAAMTSSPASKDKHHLKRSRASRQQQSTCAQQARRDISQDIDRLTDYLEESILLPKKMSYMAEMMYT